jgi:hypothetical protein
MSSALLTITETTTLTSTTRGTKESTTRAPCRRILRPLPTLATIPEQTHDETPSKSLSEDPNLPKHQKQMAQSNTTKQLHPNKISITPLQLHHLRHRNHIRRPLFTSTTLRLDFNRPHSTCEVV